MSSPIVLVKSGIPVSNLYWRILSNPQLWDTHTARTSNTNSPHHGLNDIWVRYGEERNATDNQPHKSSWYPAADTLGVKGLCLDVMRAYNGVELGGVLITRIPPGAACKPHTDMGWHALNYDKFALQIASSPGQRFCFDKTSLETKPGDLFWFNNQEKHWVLNETPYERVTMIICIRLDRGE